MNELSCRDVDDLLTGYAADALEEDERCAVATHLAECRNHDLELQGMRLSLSGLAQTVEPVEPAPALRARLLDAFDRAAVGGDQEALDQFQAQLSAAARRRRPLPLRVVSSAAFGYALAATLLLVAIGLGVWGATRGGEDDVLVRASEGQAGSIQVLYVPSRGVGVLEYELAALPTGRAYQAWHVDAGGNADSLGVLAGRAGSLAFQGDLAAGSAIALSVEPSGGSAQPTTTPILITPVVES
jgi:anti-sigma-K factor RskA